MKNVGITFTESPQPSGQGTVAPPGCCRFKSTRQAKSPLSSYSQTWCKPNSIYLKRQQEYRCVGELRCLQMTSKKAESKVSQLVKFGQLDHPGSVLPDWWCICWNLMVTKSFSFHKKSLYHLEALVSHDNNQSLSNTIYHMKSETPKTKQSYANIFINARQFKQGM